MNTIKLNRLKFIPSQILRYGTYRATATMGGATYDMTMDAWIGRRKCRKQMMADAIAYFTSGTMK
jgi:hypothetical protein